MGFDKGNEPGPCFFRQISFQAFPIFFFFKTAEHQTGSRKSFHFFQHVFSGKEGAVDLAQLSDNPLSAFGDKPSHRQMEGPPEKGFHRNVVRHAADEAGLGQEIEHRKPSLFLPGTPAA